MSVPLVAEFQHVSKIYTRGLVRRARIIALDDVSLAVPAGEVFALVGPNRAGKTTLVKTLLSICRPTSGCIRRLGAPWRDRSTLAHVGYVHESQALPRYLTARALLRYYGALTQMPAAAIVRRADELIERFGLADRSREPIARFSKGMLQRLSIAQALLNDPELLVLDEPSEGMDLLARRMLLEVIVEQRARGKSAILVSHALADVQRLCDRVAVLREGRLVFNGELSELLDRPTDEQEPSLEDALEPLYEETCA